MIQISNQDARRFLLHHQLLWPPDALKGKQGVMAVFERLGSVQYDTINVVGRNADLVMQSRIKAYNADVLDEMLYSDRSLVDGWDKMASIHPIEDWPYMKRRRQRIYNAAVRRAEETKAYEQTIIDAIREHGPLSSLDFKDDEASEQRIDWWWAPTKLARATMESLFWKDALGVHHKVNTRRVFDLADNLYPDHVLNMEEPHPDDEDYKKWHALRRIGSMGLASLRSGEFWHGIPFLEKAPLRRAVIERLVAEGVVIAVKVQELGETLYMRAQDLPTLEAAQTKRAPKAQAAFIAPLDHLLWNRALIGKLFDFEYVWEVYKPPKDRQYGYYTLPVLYGDQFVARMDAKLERKTMALNINGWWWEAGVEMDAALQKSALESLAAFGDYLNADTIAAAPSLEKDARRFLGL